MIQQKMNDPNINNQIIESIPFVFSFDFSPFSFSSSA